jgi:DeoR family transcriptional regulator, fructose operon transcriptional repressor
VIRMLQAERLEKIFELVKREKYCSITELASKFDISSATARRDLKMLEDEKKVKVTRGGAMMENQGTSQEPPYSEKIDINKAEKVRLAESACAMIKKGETILLDSGTTLFEVAKQLKNAEGITVATNDVLIACALAENTNIFSTMIGGGIRKNYYSTSGLFAQEAIKNINADKAFIGIDAFDPVKGFMITNMEEVVIKRLMMAAAKEVIVICDHSKCENVAFIKLCGIEDVNKMITGIEIGDEMYQALIDAGLDVDIV